MGSGGPPRYTRQHLIGGGTGSRVMPGPSRLPKNGVKDVYSVMYNPSAAAYPGQYPRGDNSNYTTLSKQIAIGGALNTGILTTTWNLGGIGGGPNEPGTSVYVITNGDVSGYNAAYPYTTQEYLDANGNSTFYQTNISHYRHDTGAYVNLDSRFDEFNVPFGFAMKWKSDDAAAEVNLNPTYNVSSGGGGWGSAGGTSYSGANGTGGAGGAAIKTNGNAVTFTGGQGTDRVFGAIA